MRAPGTGPRTWSHGWAGPLGSYGASVGAVRGTVRDAGRKFKGLGHDDVHSLASELWGRPGPGRRPVYERRLAAVVLLQVTGGTAAALRPDPP